MKVPSSQIVGAAGQRATRPSDNGTCATPTASGQRGGSKGTAGTSRDVNPAAPTLSQSARGRATNCNHDTCASLPRCPSHASGNTIVAGLDMRTVGGALSPSSAEKWLRRAGAVAGWLLAEWEREQARQHGEARSTSLDNGEHRATPVGATPRTAAHVEVRPAA